LTPARDFIGELLFLRTGDQRHVVLYRLQQDGPVGGDHVQRCLFDLRIGACHRTQRFKTYTVQGRADLGGLVDARHPVEFDVLLGVAHLGEAPGR